jgi:DNA modification methylase
MTVRILIGDCRERLRELPDESVHCVVTSPPYWGLRDYGCKGQIGLEGSPADYVAEIVEVFQEVRRVLRSDGTFWLNLGDSYNSIGHKKSNSGYGTTGLAGGIAQEHTPLQRENTFPGLKHKDICGIPWRVAFALQADGWWLRQDIIWSKPNPMPESVTDRCTKAHEYLFLLSKRERYYYDTIAIRECATDTGRENGRDGRDEQDGARPPGSRPRTLARLDYTQPRKIKVPGGWDRGPGAHGTIHRDGRTSAEYQEVEVPGGRNKRSVWEIATSPFAEAHFATFPPALIEPCILAGCPTGGAVLDPFGGAGTTGLVADRLQRDAILIELNPEYAAMAERRIRGEGGMFSDVRVEQPLVPQVAAE